MTEKEAIAVYWLCRDSLAMLRFLKEHKGEKLGNNPIWLDRINLLLAKGDSLDQSIP